MKSAHKYNLKVQWSNKPDWNINILSISAEAVTMWLPKEETESTYIKGVQITLIKRDAEQVKDEFLAKGLDDVDGLPKIAQNDFIAIVEEAWESGKNYGQKECEFYNTDSVSRAEYERCETKEQFIQSLKSDNRCEGFIAKS